MEATISSQVIQHLDLKAYYRSFLGEGRRPDGRKATELRPITLTPSFVDESGREPSVLVQAGDTKLVCSVLLCAEGLAV